MAWYHLFYSKKRESELYKKFAVLQGNLLENRIIGNSAPIYPDVEKYGISKTFKTVDDIYSITNKIASKTAEIDFYAYFENGDVTKFRKIRKHLPKPVNDQIRKKALEDIPETDIVYDLINFPSAHLSKHEFYKAAALFLLLHGECFLYKKRLELGTNATKYREFELLYPQFVNLLVTDGYPKEITGYEYRVNGTVVIENIPVEDIIHIKYFNPEYDIYGGELRGLSPLKVAAKRLSRLNSTMDASVAQLQNGGTPAIVYDKEVMNDGSNEIISNRKDNFYRFINNKNNKGVPYFASGEMGVINLGLPLTDMEVTALADIDFDKLCNIYGVSSTVFNSKAANTESNVKEQRAAFYTDACLPLLKMILSAIEMNVRRDFKAPYIIEPDIQSISELQQDTKTLADTLSAAPVFIPKYALEALGLGYDGEDESLSKVYIKAGYELLTDLQGVEDLPGDSIS